MNLYRVLKRDIGKEIAVSRNLGETRLIGSMRAILCAWFVCKAMLLAVRSICHERLGSHVIYQGRKCFISNWAGSEYPTLADGNGFYQQHVPRAEIRNVINLKELWHRFSSSVEFYTGCHMNNDINNRLYRNLFAR